MTNIYIKKIQSNKNPNRDDLPVRILGSENLLNEYNENIRKFMAEGNYLNAIDTYEKMYMLTGDEIYKIYIADIVLKGLNNPQKSLELYKQMEPYLKNNLTFLYGISDVYLVLKDYYNQAVYLTKVLDILKEAKDA